jgi:hypothetical protein
MYSAIDVPFIEWGMARYLLLASLLRNATPFAAIICAPYA